MLHGVRSLAGLFVMGLCLGSTASFASHEALKMHAGQIENDARMMEMELARMGQYGIEWQLSQLVYMAEVFRVKAGKWYETRHALRNHFMDLDQSVINVGNTLYVLGDMPLVQGYWYDLLYNLETMEMLLGEWGGWGPGFGGNWRNHHGNWGNWGRPGGYYPPYRR